MAKKKNKKNPMPQTANSSKPKWLSLVAVVLVGVLLFYPPFFRGLFFKEDMFLYHLLTGLVFIVVWADKLKKKDYTLLRTPLDWAVLAYSAAYLLSLIGAVHIGEAFYGFLKALNYFMIYWMVTQVVKDYKHYVAVLNILLAAGVGVASVGLLSATGYCHYPSAVVNGIIQSTLQYSNATAAYLAVMSLLAIVLWIRRQAWALKLVYGIAAYLCAMVVLAAVSKGAWLIWGIGAVLLLIGLPGLYKIKALYSLGLALAAAFTTSQKFLPAITGPDKNTGLPLLVIGIVVVLAGQAVWEALAWLRRKRGSKMATVVALALVIVAAVLFFSAGDCLIVAAPQGLINEVSQILDTRNSSYSSRIDFYRWGFAIVKDYPVFGAGAGGWNALYHQYQDYLAFSTEVHNHFLQVWIEAGTLGFIAFLAIWVLFIGAVYKLFKRFKKKEAENKAELQDNWVLIWGTAAAALALGVHAAFDFDLSIAALAILLWTLMALVNAALVMVTAPPFKIRPAVNISAAIALTLIMVYCGSNYALANHYANAGAKLEKSLYEENASQQSKSQNLLQAEDSYRRAVSLNSLDADYYAGLSHVYAIYATSLKQAGQAGVHDYYSKARTAMARAEELKPYDIKTRNSLLSNSVMLEDLELSVRQAEWTVKINPNDINAYTVEGNVIWSATAHYLNLQDFDKAGQYARETVAIESRLNKQKQRVKEDSPLWYGAKLDLAPKLRLNIGQAQYVLGQYQQSVNKLEPLIKNGQLPEAYAWYAAGLYRLGQKDKAEQIIRTCPQQYENYAQNIKLGPLQ
jgi:hypothetical protein